MKDRRREIHSSDSLFNAVLRGEVFDVLGAVGPADQNYR